MLTETMTVGAEPVAVELVDVTLQPAPTEAPTEANAPAETPLERSRRLSKLASEIHEMGMRLYAMSWDELGVGPLHVARDVVTLAAHACGSAHNAVSDLASRAARAKA
jgi:hypothetical protein